MFQCLIQAERDDHIQKVEEGTFMPIGGSWVEVSNIIHNCCGVY
jgi:hypothetical protein